MVERERPVILPGLWPSYTNIIGVRLAGMRRNAFVEAVDRDDLLKLALEKNIVIAPRVGITLNNEELTGLKVSARLVVLLGNPKLPEKQGTLENMPKTRNPFYSHAHFFVDTWYRSLHDVAPHINGELARLEVGGDLRLIVPEARALLR